jgi:aryl-alcohol dehydrogenase
MGSSSAIAAVSDGERGFSVGELEIEDPGPHEVLVEIRASGLCHTDVSMLADGRRVVVGHEGPASSPRSAKVSQGSRPAITSC